MAPFVVDRRQIVERGVAAMGVVPALDEIEDPMRASTWVLKRCRLSRSHSRVAKKLSHMALSKQSPTEPMDGRTPASPLQL